MLISYYPLTDFVMTDPKLVMEEARELRKPALFFESLGDITFTTADYRRNEATGSTLGKNMSFYGE